MIRYCIVLLCTHFQEKYQASRNAFLSLWQLSLTMLFSNFNIFTTAYVYLLGLVFVNFNQDFGCFVAVTSEGFRIFNADPLRQNKTECKSFMVLAESVKNDGENTNVYLGPAINDVVAGKSRVVKVNLKSHSTGKLEVRDPNS